MKLKPRFGPLSRRASEGAAPALCGGGGTTQLIIGDRWAERPPTMNFQTDEGGGRASGRAKERRKAKKWRGRPRQGSLEPLAGRPPTEGAEFSLLTRCNGGVAFGSGIPPSSFWAFTLHFTASCRFIFRPTDPTTSSSIENVAVASLPRRRDHTRSSGK